MTATDNRSVFLWWRDDDAGCYSASFEHLLALATELDFPLCLAVVPAWLDEPTRKRVVETPSVRVLQHGWAHVDHADTEQKSIELGGCVDSETCLANLDRGRNDLSVAFRDRSLPVLVPPWNRIADRVLGRLPEKGFAAVSTFGEDNRGYKHGLVHVNTHVDVIDWHDGRRMKPLSELVAQVEVLMTNPALNVLGILSHHREMSLYDMSRLGQLLRQITALPGCRWAEPKTVLSLRGFSF
jgi:peptidoglycan/xylan/chitin deacetylase (PgdA/CDA1 family)